MKVVFASHGSLGDLVPFLEIGKVLKARSHTVAVATHNAHAKAVTRAGLQHAPMRPDRPSDPAFHRKFMKPWSGPGFVYKEFLTPAIAEADEDLSAAAADADVLVSVTLALAAPLVAKRYGLVWRSCAFQPAMLYSILDPPRLPLIPLIKGKPAYNEWVLTAAKNGIQDWANPLRRYRASAGLGTYDDHPVFGGQHAPGGALALFSPLFGAVPPDAPSGTIQTGQVLQTGGGDLDPALSAWLASGAAPVIFTLGSASAHAARRFFAQSAKFADALGVRALFLVGDPANLAGLPQNDRARAFTAAPYQSVFPHARLIVHQGGIGTIALALAAGKPMVLVPFAHDQPDNSFRAAAMGAAVVIPRSRYALFGRGVIAQALTDEAMANAAAEAQLTIMAEHGAERAADAIESAALTG